MHSQQHQQLQRGIYRRTDMPVTTTTTPPSPAGGSPAKSQLWVQRSPRKRKFSDASAGSPTSLDEVAISSSSSTNAGKHVISPKKKTKTEERASGNLSKWESHVVASITSSLDLDYMSVDDGKDCSSSDLEPVAFSAAPAGDLAADELQILQDLLA